MLNRLTISLIGSTSSIGTAGRGDGPPRVNSPRNVISRSDCSSMREVYCLKMS